MSLDTETIQYLTVTAFLASTMGLPKQALAAADALIEARPDSTDALIVCATAKIGAGQIEEAAKILADKVLAREPSRSMAKALLGYAFDRLGRKGDRDHLAQQVLDANDDPDAVAITKGYMEAPAQ